MYKPVTRPVSIEQAQHALNLFDTQEYAEDYAKHEIAMSKKPENQRSRFIGSPRERKAIAVSLRGSHSYGLNHEKSDFDILIITDENRFKIDNMEVEGFDATVITLQSLIAQLDKGSYMLADNIASHYFIASEAWSHFFNGLAINPLPYLENAYRFAEIAVASAFDNLVKNPRRSRKQLQTLLVAGVMASRVKNAKTLVGHNPELNSDEREKFFENLESLWQYANTEEASVDGVYQMIDEFAGIDFKNSTPHIHSF